MTIEYQNVESWTELQSLIIEYFYSFPDYIFRGQAQDNWNIESSLTRLLKRSEITKDWDIFYNEQLTSFKLKARGQNLDLSNMDDNEIWAIGQHYGLATPLVDWTNSPFVALFFALTGSQKSETGKRAIWAFNLPDLNYFNKNSGIETVNPLHENKRLVSQSGLFLKLPLEEDFENIVKKQAKQDWVSMYKITFPDEILKQAFLGLDLMNINYSSLYPDLIGASLSTNQKIELNNFITDEQQKLYE